MTPNIAIVRLSEEDGEPTFVQFNIREDGVDDFGKQFTVQPGDMYRELKECQVAISHLDQDRESSFLLFSFTVLDDNNNPASVLDMPHEIFEKLVLDSIETFGRQH